MRQTAEHLGGQPSDNIRSIGRSTLALALNASLFIPMKAMHIANQRISSVRASLERVRDVSQAFGQILQTNVVDRSDQE